MFGGQQNNRQNIQQFQFGQDNAGNNQEQEDQPNQEVEEINPNAQWDLQLRMLRMFLGMNGQLRRISNQTLLRTWKLT